MPDPQETAASVSMPRGADDYARYQRMHDFATRLFPVHRSITGEGVRETLAMIAERLPDLQIREMATGTKCFDWVIPEEWNVVDAFVMDRHGRKVVDFQRHNLHLVGYSVPVDTVVSLDELQQHLHSLPDQPDAIPYVTSYYQRRWGFCMSHRDRCKLEPGEYRVVIDATLAPGSLTYGELILPGQEESEVLLSTYVCHPAMANNELSGPVVTTELAQWLMGLSDRRHTYRILFLPETIGSIAYLSLHHTRMRERTIAGYVVTCVGDEGRFTFMPSRRGTTLADRLTELVLNEQVPGYRRASFLQRGSDERQYCSPTMDLPVVSIMRTQYGKYPEYHTSLDDLRLITPSGLGGSFELIRRCIQALERNYAYRATTHCEPQLGKRGLYPTLSTRESGAQVRDMMNVWVYCDGERDLVEISRITNIPFDDCHAYAQTLHAAGLLARVEKPVPTSARKL